MKLSRWKNVLVSVSVAVLIAVSSGAAVAKDICLQDSIGAFYVFTKVKSLKHGKTVALTGQHIVGAVDFPLSGSVTMNNDGTSITAGISVHGLLNGGNDITVTWTGEPKTLAGDGFVDTDGDYLANAPLTFTSVSCNSVVIP